LQLRSQNAGTHDVQSVKSALVLGADRSNRREDAAPELGADDDVAPDARYVARMRRSD